MLTYRRVSSVLDIVKLENNILVFLVIINCFFNRYIFCTIIQCELDIWECTEYICHILSICIFRFNIIVELLEVNRIGKTTNNNDVKMSNLFEFFALHKGKQMIQFINLNFQITKIMQVAIYMYFTEILDINIFPNFQS